MAWPSSLASPWPGTSQWLPNRAQGMDLHRSFSSRVPLEVTDSAWMNSENSILPSWQEREGRGGLSQPGHLVRSDLGQVAVSSSRHQTAWQTDTHVERAGVKE